MRTSFKWKFGITLLLVIAVTFSATFFPLMYVLNSEREAHAEELGSLIKPSEFYDSLYLESVLDFISRDALFDLPAQDVLTEQMIRAAIAATGDRYAAYFNEQEYAEYRLGLSGGFVGIGVSVTKSEDGLIDILHVHANAASNGGADPSPAAAAGLMRGDLIFEIDGVSVAEVGYDAASALLVGEAGTSVNLTVLRDGVPMEFSLVRADVVKDTVMSREIVSGGHKLGYVLLTGFDGNTYSQFVTAVSAHEANGVEGFLFDVRSNGGGLLTEIAKVLAYLLPDGDVVHVRYASEEFTDYTYSARDGYLYGNGSPVLYAEGGHAVNVPMVVLVNGGTASAAELFASAIRDYTTEAFGCAVDAKLLGVKTYGKGTVQTTFLLDSGKDALKMTVAHYNPPSDENYDGLGITPDEVVEMPKELAGVSLLKLDETNDPQLIRAIALLCEMLGAAN